MYIPPHFEEVSEEEISAIIADAPLGCIVATTDEGLIANHIPLLAGGQGKLIGHVALANDMHRVLGEGSEVLVIFQREDAYVSPNYYPSKAETHRHVPTWNYQVVHCYGQISFQHDDHAKRAAVGLLTRLHERRVNGAAGWRMGDAPKDFMEHMIAGIVAFRIDVSRVLAKSKLSQNREARDLDGAARALAEAGHGAIASRMQRKTR